MLAYSHRENPSGALRTQIASQLLEQFIFLFFYFFIARSCVLLRGIAPYCSLLLLIAPYCYWDFRELGPSEGGVASGDSVPLRLSLAEINPDELSFTSDRPGREYSTPVAQRRRITT